jgi:CBS domain containing-hemolysin-like protein
MPIMNLLYIIFLISVTAFFVASEFSIIRVRTSRIDQLITEGNQQAYAAKKVISNLDSYLSAIQLGITVTSLILGWLGEPTIGKIIDPLLNRFNVPPSFSRLLSFILSFVIITFGSVVIGELAPKTFAIQKAEDIILLVAKPMIWFTRIMYPFIWILNRSSRFVTKLFGIEPASENDMAHSEEELRIILSESLKSGEINQSEYSYVNNIFEFDNRIAKEIMVPRTEIVSLDKTETINDVLPVMTLEKYTRYPITDGDKDNIIGVVNIKEVLTDCVTKKCMGDESIEVYCKPILHVIETVPIQSLLARMQKDRTHMAVLLDEYGGTAGIVTVEDILEEIVGEIRDEFDADEVPLIRKLTEKHYMLDAKVLIEDVNDLLGTHISDEEVDTIGGWLLTQKYDLKQEDTLIEENMQFRVAEMQDSHVLYVEVRPVPVKEAPANDI